MSFDLPSPDAGLRDPDLAEAERLMTVCNSCRYCEGLCAVFPAMELRRSFADGDLQYLANLCHSCGACYHDCQFSPPHAFDVNVPAVLARVRNDSYEAHAWPAALRPLFRRHGAALVVGVAVAAALFLAGFVAAGDPGALWTAHRSPELFYALMPHAAMVALFGAAFAWMLLAVFMGARSFWKATGAPVDGLALGRAGHDAATLRYLDGGGMGCMNEGEEPDDRRRLWHHFTFYGFLLCLASTSVATVYHYVFDRPAPYPLWDLPKILGTLGGIGLVIGPVGLLRAKAKRLPDLADPRFRSMEVGFLAILLLTGASGLALMALRTTPLLGPMLALHLGAVLALFLSMPYGKFVHGLYRYLALARWRREDPSRG